MVARLSFSLKSGSSASGKSGPNMQKKFHPFWLYDSCYNENKDVTVTSNADIWLLSAKWMDQSTFTLPHDPAEGDHCHLDLMSGLHRSRCEQHNCVTGGRDGGAWLPRLLWTRRYPVMLLCFAQLDRPTTNQSNVVCDAADCHYGSGGSLACFCVYWTKKCRMSPDVSGTRRAQAALLPGARYEPRVSPVELRGGLRWVRGCAEVTGYQLASASCATSCR